VIISDFLTDTEELEQVLNRLKNSEVILVNTLDETELEPDMEGDKILKDPETGSKLRTYLSKKTKSKYRKELEDHTGEIEEMCQKYGASYILASTGEDVFESFLKIWRAIN